MKIFITAILMRWTIAVILLLSFQGQDFSALSGDPLEYYKNAQHLENANINPELNYTYWWERSPLYTLFIHITSPLTILVQIVIGSLGVYWMWKINPAAGWIWNFWEWGYSLLYYKECLMYALIIFIIYKVKE
jgi:hypothetical protein